MNNLFLPTERQIWDCLASALQLNDQERRNYLVNNQAHKIKDRFNESTALHLIARIGGKHTELIEDLLDLGADINAIDRVSKRTPLHHASCNWKMDVIRKMIEFKAKVEVRDEHHFTPLHHAATYADPAMCEILLKSGANIHAKDSDGKTPLHLAALNEHVATGIFLLESGACLYALNKFGKAPGEMPSDQGSTAWKQTMQAWVASRLAHQSIDDLITKEVKASP